MIWYQCTGAFYQIALHLFFLGQPACDRCLTASGQASYACPLRHIIVRVHLDRQCRERGASDPAQQHPVVVLKLRSKAPLPLAPVARLGSAARFGILVVQLVDGPINVVRIVFHISGMVLGAAASMVKAVALGCLLVILIWSGRVNEI